MRAFLLGIAAMIAIGVVVAVAYQFADTSAATAYSSGSAEPPRQ